MLNHSSGLKQCTRPNCVYVEHVQESLIITDEDILPTNDALMPFVEEYTFLSHSTVGKEYTVIREAQEFWCDCPGFGYRKKCRHIEKAKKQYNESE
tara:strand:+ start:340 stop:627 length:288 start_codon:yes stop_codon:yes gene_type:complete